VSGQADGVGCFRQDKAMIMLLGAMSAFKEMVGIFLFFYFFPPFSFFSCVWVLFPSNSLAL